MQEENVWKSGEPTYDRSLSEGSAPRVLSKSQSNSRFQSSQDVPEFHRILLTPTLDGHKPSDPAHRDARPTCIALAKALELRQQYVYQREVAEFEDSRLQQFTEATRRAPFDFATEGPAAGLPCSRHRYSFTIGPAGVAQVTRDGSVMHEWQAPTLTSFHSDLEWLWEVVCNGKSCKSVAHERLQMLEKNFNYHFAVNWSYEAEEVRLNLSDFRRVVKVDTHIHAASAFTHYELLDFIQQKIQDPREVDRVVATCDDHQGGLRPLTLRSALQEAGMSSDPDKVREQLTVDRLNVSANNPSMFHRFDNFNDSYSPMASPNLRAIFMKTSNHIGGQYFAELLHIVFKRLRTAAHRREHGRVELRLSIYGRSPEEWDELARWWLRHRMLSLDPDGASDDHVRWVIQIPRLYNVFCKSVGSFGALLRNIFTPLFEVTIDPQSHPELHLMLAHVGYFDCVDDESVLDDLRLHTRHGDVLPDQYAYDPADPEGPFSSDPPYSYFLYHLFANLKVLNRLREARGWNTWPFKPHAGEAGMRHHLATAFLLADSVNHGVKLAENPPLHYLFYLAQIGLAMCPTSNDALFVKLDRSPIGSFFRQGLAVSLGTDDPLQFHHTSEPLLEEYVVASRAFGFTTIDFCEIARASVLMSGFSHAAKARWLGAQYFDPSPPHSNEIDKTNVATSRLMFRSEMLRRELFFVAIRASTSPTLDNSRTGTVRIGAAVVHLDLERQVQLRTRELHEFYNHIYYLSPTPSGSPSSGPCAAPSSPAEATPVAPRGAPLGAAEAPAGPPTGAGPPPSLFTVIPGSAGKRSILHNGGNVHLGGTAGTGTWTTSGVAFACAAALGALPLGLCIGFRIGVRASSISVKA